MQWYVTIKRFETLHGKIEQTSGKHFVKRTVACGALCQLIMKYDTTVFAYWTATEKCFSEA